MYLGHTIYLVLSKRGKIVYMYVVIVCRTYKSNFKSCYFRQNSEDGLRDGHFAIFHEGKKKYKFEFCPKKTTLDLHTMYKMLKAPPFFKSQNFFGTSLNNNNDNKSEHAHRMILKS